MKWIDAHIHLEMYKLAEQRKIMESLGQTGACASVIAVSMDLASCRRTRQLAAEFPGIVHPAYGFHPEQPLPAPEEREALFRWIREHAEELVAIGEVGLPYYRRQEQEARGERFDREPYLAFLAEFVRLGKEWNKPIILHAVYDDAELVCDLLEEHQVRAAHFHWYKGPLETTRRMIENGYLISFTPDLCYEPEIQELAKCYPLAQIMVETDGPWPFEGSFRGRMTEPAMIADVLSCLARIKGLDVEEVARAVWRNTTRFYGLQG